MFTVPVKIYCAVLRYSERREVCKWKNRIDVSKGRFIKAWDELHSPLDWNTEEELHYKTVSRVQSFYFAAGEMSKACKGKEISLDDETLRVYKKAEGNYAIPQLTTAIYWVTEYQRRKNAPTPYIDSTFC